MREVGERLLVRALHGQHSQLRAGTQAQRPHALAEGRTLIRRQHASLIDDRRVDDDLEPTGRLALGPAQILSGHR